MARRSSVEDFVVDFSKEEESAGGGIRVKRGTYPVKAIAYKVGTSEDKGTPYLEITFQFTEGKYKGKKLKERLYRTPKALARIRTLLEAVGKKAPRKAKLSAIGNAVKGEELYIEVDDDEREGYKTRSRVTFEGFISVDDAEDESDESDEDEDEDLDEDDDELEEDDDEEEDDDDEEEEAPKRRRSRRKESAKPKARKRRPRDEDEDDDDLDLDDF
jgi:hypothetical protein